MFKKIPFECLPNVIRGFSLYINMISFCLGYLKKIVVFVKKNMFLLPARVAW